MVSAYENGHREPSLATLRRLVGATGQRLTVDVVPTRPLGLPDTPRGRLLRRHRSAIRDIAARYGASNIRVFGSVARGDDGPDSDVDLAADIPQDFSLVGLSGLGRELSELLDVDVDLVPTRASHRTSPPKSDERECRCERPQAARPDRPTRRVSGRDEAGWVG